MNDINNKLLQFCLEKIPKLLSHLDRDEDSLTYGCFDRDYWHYKVRDYCSLILQQAGFLLAFLWKYQDKKNIYYQNSRIKKWSKAAILFWANNIEKDGSANEYYPFEKSIPAVAFSLYRINQSLIIIDDFSADEKQIIVNAQKRAAEFLILNQETKASNQEMAAAIAVYLTGKLLKNDYFIKCAEEKIELLIHNNYSYEGWFIEYGGADIGYLSITLEALVDYYDYSNNLKIIGIIKNIVEFTNYGIFTNGTVGGQLNSRNTEYFLPYGLFKAIEIIPDIDCKSYFKIINSIDKYLKLHSSFDDRYLLHYTLPSFVKTTSLKIFDLNPSLVCSKLLPDSGWYYKYDGKNEIHFAFKKGGVIKIIIDGKLFYSDYGYRLIKKDNIIGVTNWQNSTIFESNGLNSFSIKGKLMKIKLKKPTPLYHLLLRLFSFLFGRQIINIIKRKLIFIESKLNVKFIRNIIINENQIDIIDKINSDKTLDGLKKACKYSLRHVASSKSFVIDELENDLINTYFKIVKDHQNTFSLKLTIDLNQKKVIKNENTFN